MRARTWVVVILVGLAAVVGASVLSMHPSLSDARDGLDAQWAAVRPQLDARYESLAALSRAVRAADADLDVLDEVDDAVGDWQGRAAPGPEAGPPAANRVEGQAARLARTASVRPSLRQNGDVAQALRDFLGTDPRAALETYNEGVERYDRARSRFPGPFFASILGFDSLETVEVPGVFDDLDVPPAPPPETTTSAPAGAGVTPPG